jgi:tetratricopeptide (TPR) repeat protein
MKRTVVFVGGALLLATLVFPMTQALAQGLADDVAALQPLVDQEIIRISTLERIAFWLAVMVWARFFMGAVLAALQGTKIPSKVTITVVLGLLISGITGFEKLGFDEGHRAVQSRAEEARTIASQINLWLIEGYDQSSDEERAAWLEKIGDQILKLQAVTRRYSSPVISPEHASFDLVPAAYAGVAFAQPGRPKWIDNPPEGKDIVYVVGVADSPTIEGGQENARDNAVQSAAAYFRHLGESSDQPGAASVNWGELADYILERTDPIDTWYEFRKQSRTYRFYTLIGIRRQTVETRVRLYEILHRTKVPKKVVESFAIEETTTGQYLHAQTDSMEGDLDYHYTNLTPDAYREFVVAQSPRLQMNDDSRTGSSNPQVFAMEAEPAAPALEEPVATSTMPAETEPPPVVSRSRPRVEAMRVMRDPHQMLQIWLRSAQSNIQSGDIAKARLNFERAAEIEAQLPERDARFHAAYGKFLLAQGQPAAAVRHLTVAAELDPNNAEVNRLLTRARERTPSRVPHTP